MMIKIKILGSKEKLKGGAGDNKPDSDFDPEQLAIGIDDETGEHTPDPQIGKEIAKDHLSKEPDYYRKLKAAGIEELQEQNVKKEIYLNDLLKKLKEHDNKVWVFFDTETVGMDPNTRQLTEIAAISVKPNFSGGTAGVIDQFHVKISLTDETKKELQKPFAPKYKGEKSIKDILDMTQYFSSNMKTIDEQDALKSFIEFISKQETKGEVLLLAHNALFDRKFITVRSKKYNFPKLNQRTLDTIELLYDFFYPLISVSDKEGIMNKIKSKGPVSFTLGSITSALNIDNKNWHTALSDVTALIKVTQEVIKRLEDNKDLDVRSGVEKSIMLQRNRKKFFLKMKNKK